MNLRKLTPEAVNGKVILIRCDFNVPIKEGQVREDTRLRAVLPTFEFLLENGAKRIHIMTHLGRPKGVPDPKFTVEPVAPAFAKLLGETVEFRPDFTAGTSRIQLHENTRFYPGEKKNDEEMAREIVEKTGAEVFVIDGFAVVHRAHASVVGPAKFLPSFAGFLVESEIKHLSPFLTDQKIEGLTVLISGMKMETKVPVLKKFAEIAENVLVGGALANTFLAAGGKNIGGSFFEETEFENAREVIKAMEKNKTNFILPQDGICAIEIDASSGEEKMIADISQEMKIFDVGSWTIAAFKDVLRNSKVIIWNGPLGVFENPAFSNGTKEIVKVIAEQKSAQTILGGGDTLAAMKKFGVGAENFTHVSTGGGAMLEFLEGKDLPGLMVLQV